MHHLADYNGDGKGKQIKGVSYRAAATEAMSDAVKTAEEMDHPRFKLLTLCSRD